MSKLKFAVKIGAVSIVPLIASWCILGGVALPLAVFKSSIIKENSQLSKFKAQNFAKKHWGNDFFDKYETKPLVDKSITTLKPNNLNGKIFEDNELTALVNGQPSHIFETTMVGQIQSTEKVMIFVHGLNNTHWNVTESMKYWIDKGYRVLSFDMRGFGENYNNGVVTFGYHEATDLKNVYQAVANALKPRKIVIYGQSNGAATTLSFAERNQNVINMYPSIETFFVEESSFTSPKQQFNDLLSIRGIFPAFVVPLTIPFYEYYTGQNLNGSYDYLANIKNITQKLFIIHGKMDQVVEFNMGKSLYDRAHLFHPTTTEFYFSKTLGHIGVSRDTWDSKKNPNNKEHNKFLHAESPNMFKKLFKFLGDK